AVNAPFTKCMQDNLRVRGGNESAAPGAKLTPQFHVIVDFSVEYQDHVAVFTDKWLVSPVEIDDPQAHRPQRDIRRFSDALLVRTAMNEHTDSVSNTSRTHTMEPMRETSNTAQGLSPLEQNRRNRNSGRKASPNAK